MGKRKISVVVTNRASYARIKTVLQAIHNHPALELQLIPAASALLDRKSNLAPIIEDDGLSITAKVQYLLEGEDTLAMAKSTGLAIIELSSVFRHLNPDIVLTVADRFETLATAVAATYMNLPLAHTQGGEVTGSIDESVRHAITKLAHIHLTTNEETAERIGKMGEEDSRVYITGCPSIDLLGNIDLSLVRNVFEKYEGIGTVPDSSKPYVVVMQHPVTTEYGDSTVQIEATIEAIRKLKMQTVWLWPNIDAGADKISRRLRQFINRDKPDYVIFYKNLTAEDYASLINNCACLIGNSSSGIREGSFLGVPVVNIGTRQNGRQKGPNVIDVPYDAGKIYESIKQQIEHGKYEKSTMYGDGKAGEKIAEILARCDVEIQKKMTY